MTGFRAGKPARKFLSCYLELYKSLKTLSGIRLASYLLFAERIKAHEWTVTVNSSQQR